MSCLTLLCIHIQNKSYLHVRWLNAAAFTTDPQMKGRLHRFTKKDNLPIIDEDDVINPSFLEVDRIISVRNSYSDENEYLVKWRALPYESSTWEDPKAFNDDAKITRFQLINDSSTARSTPRARPKPSTWVKLVSSPTYKNKHVLRPWQIDGLNWMLFNWYNKRGCILADEMGLGKTAQTISCLQHVVDVYARGPFLVIVPLSTIAHWQREFEGWTDLNVVVYQGSKVDRDLIRAHEFSFLDKHGREIPGRGYKFTVLLVTYESVMSDSTQLAKIQWKFCVVDEAHRLKNKNSKLFKALKTFDLEHRVLLTGTPIQNNIEELWTLLNFIAAQNFCSLQEFSSEFGDLKDSSQVEKLHNVLRPYLLRRLKEDVAKNIPPKEETVIEVELTILQKQYYKAVLERNRSFLNKGCQKSNVPKLINIVMQLRKVCNHPFLLEGVEEKATAHCITNADILTQLISTSGKLVLVDKLLPKLKRDGHKVLIFSQLKMVLDLIELYLQLKEYIYERIDGNIRGNERQAAIDRFSQPDSDRFVFMLSTRAGGLGINLTTADTVIIFDSDWNPQNDMQAQARCHRLGQDKPVQVYRLIAARTYEVDMFQRASKKLGLGQAVLMQRSAEVEEAADGIGSDTLLSKMDSKEIDGLIKYGAYDLFNERADNASRSFCEEDIDQILQTRARVIRTEVSQEQKDADNVFSKAVFASSDTDTKVKIDDPDFWEKLLPDLKSPAKLLARLQKEAEFATEQVQEEIFSAVNEHVDDVIAAHQTGVSPENLQEVLQLLAILSSHNDLSKQRRQMAQNWTQAIEHPRRYKRTMEKYGDAFASGQMAPPKAETVDKNPLGGLMFTRAERRHMAHVFIACAGLALLPRPSPVTVEKSLEAWGKPRKGKGKEKKVVPPPVKLDPFSIALNELYARGDNIWNVIRKQLDFRNRTLCEIIGWGLCYMQLCISMAQEAEAAIFTRAREALVAAVPRDLHVLHARDKEAIRIAAKAPKDIEPPIARSQVTEPEEAEASDNEKEGQEETTPRTVTEKTGPSKALRVSTRRRRRDPPNPILEAVFVDPLSLEAKQFPSLEDKQFLKRLQVRSRRNARHIKLVSKVCEQLHDHIKAKVTDHLKDRDTSDLSTPRELGLAVYADLPVAERDRGEHSRPAKWWNAECDRDLLIGVTIHGLDFGMIRADPTLAFSQKAENTVSDGTGAAPLASPRSKWHCFCGQTHVAGGKEGEKAGTFTSVANSAALSIDQDTPPSPSAAGIKVASTPPTVLVDLEGTSEAVQTDHLTCAQCSCWFHPSCIAAYHNSAGSHLAVTLEKTDKAALSDAPADKDSGDDNDDREDNPEPGEDKEEDSDGDRELGEELLLRANGGEWECPRCSSWPAERVLELRVTWT
jgi:hypothetical protein